VKWLSILWQLIRDVLLTGLGCWIIWKEVESPVPDTALLVVALGCIAPAARTAVAAILSGPGSSSESPAPLEEPPSQPSPPEGGGTGE
jgi:hypothetical protein